MNPRENEKGIQPEPGKLSTPPESKSPPEPDVQAEGQKSKSLVRIKHVHKFIYACVVLLIVASLGGYLYYHYRGNSKIATSSNNATASNIHTQPASNVCFMADGSFKCVDTEGQNLVSYDLPTISGSPISALVPNMTDTQYLGSTGSSWWLLDKGLRVVKQLSFPNGLAHNSVGAASWSHDDKYIFIELDGPNNDRQIYKYSLATDGVTKLTSQGYNSSPYQTQDGHILYTYFSGNSGNWMPYIMDANGDNAKELTALSYVNGFAGLSYDAATDTVFVDNFGNTGKIGSGNLSFETVHELLSGTSPKKINLDVQNSGDGEVLRLNETSVLWPDSLAPGKTTGQIINLNTGVVEHTIDQYGVPGTPVGLLSNLKAANLTSDPYAGWKSYTLKNEKISFRYPADWSLTDKTSADSNVYYINGQLIYTPGSDIVDLVSNDSLQIQIHTAPGPGEVDSAPDAKPIASLPVSMLDTTYYLNFVSDHFMGYTTTYGANIVTNATSAYDFILAKNITLGPGANNSAIQASPPIDYIALNYSQLTASYPVTKFEQDPNFDTAIKILESMAY